MQGTGDIQDVADEGGREGDVPIDWPAVVNSLVNLGVRTVFVTGPENLFRRVQCTVRNFEVIAVDPKNTLKKMLRPVRSSSPRAVSP